MNYEKLFILVDIVEFAMICSIFSTALNQSVKNISKKWNSTLFNFISCLISVAVGYFMAVLFSDFSNYYAIFTGFIVMVGAKGIYNSLDKMGVVSSIKDRKEVVEIPVSNKIERSDIDG